MMRGFFILFMLCFLMTSLPVAAGPVPRNRIYPCPLVRERMQQTAQAPHKELPASESPRGRVKVYKPDGSLQCGMGTAKPLEEMARELKGIRIYKSERQMDGRMRITQCGTPTGMCNVYEIDRTSLGIAMKLGFREWLFGDSR